MDPQQLQQLTAAINHVIGYLERIALATEQISLEMDGRPLPSTVTSPVSEIPAFRSNPTQIRLQANGPWLCPLHGTPSKIVPAGVSRLNGKPYTAFEVCSTPFCKEKPPARTAQAAQLP